MFTIKSVAHLFAKGAAALVSAAKKAPAVEQKTEAVLQAVQNTKPVVESVTALVYPSAVTLEDAAYAVLGCVLAALHAGGDAAKVKFSDAGLDVAAIQKAEAAYASVPQLAALASTLK